MLMKKHQQGFGAGYMVMFLIMGGLLSTVFLPRLLSSGVNQGISKLEAQFTLAQKTSTAYYLSTCAIGEIEQEDLVLSGLLTEKISFTGLTGVLISIEKPGFSPAFVFEADVPTNKALVSFLLKRGATITNDRIRYITPLSARNSALKQSLLNEQTYFAGSIC